MSVNSSSLRALVDLLLGLALVVAGLSLRLLGAVAGDGADDVVLLAGDAVGGALGVAFGAGGVVLALTCGALALVDDERGEGVAYPRRAPACLTFARTQDRSRCR